MQFGKLESVSEKMDKSLQELQRGLMGSGSNDPSLHQYSTSTKPMELVEPVSIGPVPQSLLVSHVQTGQVHVNTTNPGPRQFQLRNDQFGGMESFLRNSGPEQLSVPVKRKFSMEPTPYNVGLEHSSMPNKRVAQMENRPWLQQVSVPNKRAVQMQHMSPAPVSQLSPAANKKAVPMEHIPDKAGQQRSSTPKNPAAQKNPPSKVQNQSFESVRSKMRESLTAALDLVSQPEEKSSNAGQSSRNEAERTSAQNKENAQPAAPVSTAGNVIGFDSEEARETLCPKENSFSNPANEDENALHKTLIPADPIETHASRFDGSEFQHNFFSYEDMSIGEEFVKDELLRGNGLSWVLDSTIEVSEKNEIQSAEKHKLGPKVVDGSLGLKALESPESLAFKIEAELFKFFGGVNKKYKEKGRSLLFNLKDPNNPGLRDRVMSGQIPPERLCSMTAEELASEELAQWRMAKAEEFAQMVFLPDTEVDRRCFVKKTHKGEFQVIELDDNTSVDISSGSSFSQTQPNNNEKDEPSPNKADAVKDANDTAGVKNIVEDKDVSYTLTIPSNEGSDLILDDVLKDAEFLPPIVSLDEFMESLDTEPPFENLSAEAKNSRLTSEKDYSGSGSEVKSSSLDPKDRIETIRDKNNKNIEGFSKADANETSVGGPSDLGSSDHRNDARSPDTNTGLKSSDSNGDEKSSDSHVKSAMASPAGALKVECVWEGLLQLNLMATSSVTGVFISGEKARPKGWPSSLEIKGRVRLDAFEKFLQQLPLSRSRAVMVLHFDLKEGCPEDERPNLSEAADSYVIDERVGIAEPASGVELYFCPPNNKIVELLGQIVRKDDVEALNAINTGLIGVLVWRKPQLTSSTTLSPNSTSHYNKLSSKKQQHITSRRKQDTTSSNMNYNNFSPQNTRMPHGGGGFLPVATSLQPQLDEDEDVPPGFGPPASRDEDDLPEYKFSGGMNPSESNSSARSSRGSEERGFHQSSQIPYCPVDQMRELVHKYGQTRSDIPSRNSQEKGNIGLETQPWNDDEDDIPEWQPKVPQHQLPSPTPRPQYLLNQPPHFSAPMPIAQSSAMPLPPQNVHPLLQQQGGWWGPPVQGNNSMQPNNIGCQINGGHLYGTATQPGMSHSWRDNPSQS